jgi:hypothetical protein
MADAVAYGQILSAKRNDEHGNVSYTLSVERSWKANLDHQIVISTGTTCAFSAEVGQTYVIFLLKRDREDYQTAKCMGNRPKSSAANVLGYLRTVAPAR